jgi:hypothetical protein
MAAQKAAGEEARWRRELAAREAARASALEAEWRRREAARDAEAAALREEYGALEGRARQVRVSRRDRVTCASCPVPFPGHSCAHGFCVQFVRKALHAVEVL